ncbi:MAG: hypothetical protein J7J07_06905 [Syntrophobacterales bacterium]|nr:hypothetical protein [Syntrophobacterales bacterium]
MKYPLALFLILLMAIPAYGRDMRKACRKAEMDHKASLSEAKASEKRIFKDRESLKGEILRLESEKKSLNKDITSMQNEFNKLKKKEKALSSQKSKIEMDMRELTGTARVTARDLESILKQSFFTARFPGRIDLLEPSLKKGRFPGMGDFKTITDLFFQEMSLSGEVILRKGSFVDRSGVTTDGDILTIGKFSAAYKTGKECCEKDLLLTAPG